MKKIHLVIGSFFIIGLILSACNMQSNRSGNESVMSINDAIQKQAIDELQSKFPEANQLLIEKGVKQVANLWRTSDGSPEEFNAFCLENYAANDQDRAKLFNRLEKNYEILNGYLLKMELLLKEQIDMDRGPLEPIDYMFGTYDPSSHITEDFYANKIAFITSLNFPNFTLSEKSEMADKWTRQEWAYARMGDKYTSRVPAEVIQNSSKVYTMGDAYISSYNIYLGHLWDQENKSYFPEDLRLITHWGLRDELKSNYSVEDGQAKQEMIFAVMNRIIDQSIPEMVINSNDVDWNPYDNKVYKDGNEISFVPEPDTRYEILLENFYARRAFDEYNPSMPTYIQRRFEGDMEISQEDVEALFIDLVSSPVVKDVAALIKSKLGRELRPYDIWFNGFAGRNSVSEIELDKIVKKKYPTALALEQDLPNIMMKLGFSKEDAKRITSLVRVDASRGIGHAWGSEMRNEKARLRTRVKDGGMTYKGYNIAVHEFGHNVEQTITMNDVDFYMMNGVPNTAFTEALAFIFQKRDLELLGISENNPEKEHMMALANFWSCYEIMGVSLVDMNVWKWLYANPNATKAELKVAVMTIAKDIWNKYFAEVFGSKDETILAIYSHMIDNPLYLSAYPIGHVIDFQLEQQLSGKDFAAEVFRIYTQGVVVPQFWMKNAVGSEISTVPLIEATKKALEVIIK